ncbi:MAG: hypothetical protein IMF19_15075 [Proteobacteria bacterium]|nr:hypothetical protein [Pseudomonadota bacterium]
MNAKELKWLLRRQTGCSYHRMIVPDKNYDSVVPGMMHHLIKVYSEDQKKYSGEEWDCDDIARDFWCFAKRVKSNATKENKIVGRVIFPDHAEIIYVQGVHLESNPYYVYYVDQRNWHIRKPDKKPKWIEL